MLKPIVLDISLALLPPTAAFAQAAAPAAAAKAQGPAAAPAWVARSNEYAQILIRAHPPFVPKQMSFFGIPGFDDRTFDYGPGYARRFREATAQAKAELVANAASEKDPNVKQDIAILTRAADDSIEASEVNERLTRPWMLGCAVGRGGR